MLETFRQELSKLGWIEGKTITIDYRFAEQSLERLPDLAADLIHPKVDLIVTSRGPTPLAAKKATSSIPIVMTASVDPVASSLVASLARPGGNVTGVSLPLCRAIRVLDCRCIRFIGAFCSGKVMAKLEKYSLFSAGYTRYENPESSCRIVQVLFNFSY